MSQALRYVPPRWSLWRSGGGREMYKSEGDRDRRNNGSRHETKRLQTAPFSLPHPDTVTTTLCYCRTANVSAVMAACVTVRWEQKITAPGPCVVSDFISTCVLSSGMGTSGKCGIDSGSLFCLSFIYFKVYLTMLQQLRLSLKVGIVSE
jgi:hypothetical protein